MTLKIYTGSDFLTVGGQRVGANVLPTAPGAPVSGQIWMDSDDGVQRIWNGTAWQAPSVYMETDYVNTTPTAPTQGAMLFTRNRARRLPAFIGPLGQDSQLQPALFSNRAAWLQAVNNTTAPTLEGLAVTWLNNATATPTAVANAATNFYTSMVRVRAATTAVAGTGGGVRSATAQWMLSSTANKGGLFLVVRFGFNVVAAGSRCFIGMSTSTAALAPAVDPSTLLNLFGFGFDAGDANFQFMRNDGAGAAVKTDLGASFAKAAASATNFYEARIFAPSGGGQSVYYSLHRLNDGAIATGGPITTDLPAVDTLLAFHVHIGNGLTAAAHSIDVQSVYVETDN